MVKREERDAIVAVNYLVHFAAIAGMYGAETSNLIIKYLEEARVGTSKNEREMLDHAIEFIRKEQDINDSRGAPHDR